MENIKVKEYLEIKIDHYPYYKSLNKKIIEDVKTLSFYPSQNFQYTNIKGTQHNFKLGGEPNNIKLILQWIRNLIPSFDFNSAISCLCLVSLASFSNAYTFLWGLTA